MATPPESAPPQETDDIRRATALIRHGRVDEAQPILARLLKTNPQSEDGWLLLSMTVKDRQKQMDCLRQVLRINPDHQLAKSRLAKLTRPPTGPLPGPAPGPPATPQPQAGPAAARPVPPLVSSDAPGAEAKAADGKPWHPVDESAPPPGPARPRRAAAPKDRASRGRGCAIALLVALGLLLLVALGFLAIRALTPQPRAANPTELAALINTLPPTWTATITATITATATTRPTATITVTPSPLPPDPTTLAEMDTIQREVADIRGLEIRNAAVPRYVVSKARVRPILEASFVAHGGSQEELVDEATVLSALGLIKPTYDLFTNALNGLTDNIGGFYFPWNDELYVIGSRFSGVERWVFSHEFGHALVDQHYNIDALGVYPMCNGDQQRCAAIRALVEGDATLVMNQWFEQYVRPQDIEDILRYQPPAATLPEQFPPPYLYMDSAFPYEQGFEFVRQLWVRGRWARVNEAYEDLPDSTEQILHPDKYITNEGPVTVAEAPLGEVLTNPPWRSLVSNSLGEWTTYLLLGYGADVDSQLEDETARRAAAGWGGDRYQVYANDTTGEAVLAAHWVWDTPIDARTFDDAMQDYLDRRFVGGALDSPAGECWQANAQVTCVYLDGRESLWLLAPTLDLIEQLRALFPAFG
ncbi:MAG TPA: hypothetical protein VFI11_02740 [Anaerolineales bacterium]|nr:hypothetical protein [Anaerolineales bacterium]